MSSSSSEWKRYKKYVSEVEEIRVNGVMRRVDDVLGADSHDWTSVKKCNDVHRLPFFFVREDSERFVLRYFERPEDVQEQRLFGKVYFGALTEGPAQHCHGGALCAVLDHVLGRLPFHVYNERPGVRGKDFKVFLVASINVNMRRSVPTESVQYFEAYIESQNERKCTAWGRIYDSEGHTYAEATALIVEIPKERYKKMLLSKQQSKL